MAPPRLLYLVTEDWYFISHRLPMAQAAKRAGYEVHVATRVKRHGAEIEAHGFKLHQIGWRRGSLDVFSVARSMLQIRALYRRLNPALVHHVALQPSVVGSLAAVGLPMARVNAIAGLGYAFTGTSLKARIVRNVLVPVLRRFASDKSVVLVQNADDRTLLQRLGLRPANIELIGSSGVEVSAFTPLPEPADPVPVIGIATRMLAIKGVETLVEASRLLRRRGIAHKVILAGAPDARNPSSISEDTLRAWGSEPGITWLGHQKDVRKLWEASHIAVLTSLGGEGIPKTLLEAAACGRPIVATDVPGCREIARPGRNGLLVPPGDANALADALEALIKDPALRRRFGAEGRVIVEQEYSSDLVGRKTAALYDRLTGRADQPAVPAEIERGV